MRLSAIRSLDSAGLTRLARGAGLAAALVPASGCALLLGYGDEVELASRGGADAGDATAPVGDAGAGTDAALDARPDGPFCDSLTPKPLFCSSFDGPTLFSDWPENSATNVRLERDTTSFVSSPASLRVAFDRTVSGGVGGGGGVTFETWANKPLLGTIGLDVQIEAAAPAGALAVFATPFYTAAPGKAAYLLQLVGRPRADGNTIDVSLVEVTNTPDAAREHPSSVPLQRGAWTHVELTFGHGGATNAARLAFGGVVGFDGPLELTAPGTPCGSYGIATVDATTTAWAYRLDNIVIDFR